ncbi:putative tyrosine-protein phosphatase [Iris pallida]|uniref:Tyrosine-protein phosphatase n=1 Tax=Iris pallida TaxID=29817 RepID=A0AAX6GLQ7_IRIPA|nr:putative tyrosine-protein phosphatase [Iris pallida]
MMILEIPEEDRDPSMAAAAAKGGADLFLPPPPNFAKVDLGIYRSGFPNADNLGFLGALNLRSVVYLCPERYADANAEFVRSHGIRLFQFPIEVSKIQGIILF